MLEGLTGSNAKPILNINLTLLADPRGCKLTTFDLTLAAIDYNPSLAGNSMYYVILAIYLFINLFLGIKHTT